MTIANSNIKFKISGKEDFEALFRQHYSVLCSYANKFIDDIDASEEIVQDLFCNLWNNREKLEISSIKSYLFRAVRNSCFNLIKHINIREEYKTFNESEIKLDEDKIDDNIDASELEVKIRETIELMPPERKKVFIMSRFEGLKYKEIAERQNISIKTVENQMGKAIKFLKEQLSDYLILASVAFLEFIYKILNL